MCDVDLQRLETLNEVFAHHVLKQNADLELFLMRCDVSDREKIESLYIIYDAYNRLIDYVEYRIDKINEGQWSLIV